MSCVHSPLFWFQGCPEGRPDGNSEGCPVEVQASLLTSENKFCCLVLSLLYNLRQRSFVVTIRIIDKKLTRDLT